MSSSHKALTTFISEWAAGLVQAPHQRTLGAILFSEATRLIVPRLRKDGSEIELRKSQLVTNSEL